MLAVLELQCFCMWTRTGELLPARLEDVYSPAAKRPVRRPKVGNTALLMTHIFVLHACLLVQSLTWK